MKTLLRGRHLALVIFAIAVFGVLADSALGAVQEIQGSAMTIWVGDVGGLQSQLGPPSGTPPTTPTSGEFFDHSSAPANAGFFLGFPVDTGPGSPAPIPANTLFGPTGPSDMPFTTVSQTAPSGTGTAASPYTQATTYKIVGSDGKDYLQVAQTVQHVSGTTRFEVSYAVTNVTGARTGPGAQTVQFRASEAADTFIGGSDTGTGIFSAGPPRLVGGVDANNHQGGIQEVTAGGLPAWSHFQEDNFGTIWQQVANTSLCSAGGGFQDTINPNNVDNGVGVQWDDHYSSGTALAPGATAHYALIWTFGPKGASSATPPQCNVATPTSPTSTPTLPSSPTPQPIPQQGIAGTSTTSTNPPPPVVLGCAPSKGSTSTAECNPVEVKKKGKFDVFVVAQEAGDQFSLTATFDNGKGAKSNAARAAAAKTYGTASATATHAGPLALTVNPTKAGRKALRKHGQLSVTVHLAFRSSAHLGSATSTKDFRIAVHSKGKKKKH